MPSATYGSRAYASLRSVAPLPKAEYLALRKSVTQLTTIGGNLNQLARAANQGEEVANSGMAELGGMLKVAMGLRDDVRALLVANGRSWRDGEPLLAVRPLEGAGVGRFATEMSQRRKIVSE